MGDARRWRIGAGVAAIRAIKRHGDNEVIINTSTNDFYRFNAASSVADDGDGTLKPDNIHASLPGRWIKSNPPGAVEKALAEEIKIKEDFINGRYDSTAGRFFGQAGAWKAIVNGAGATMFDTLSDTNHPGVARLRSLNTDSYAVLTSDPSPLKRGPFTIEMGVLLLTDIPTSGNDFASVFGLFSSIVGAKLDASQNMIAFAVNYTEDNSVRWLCICRNGGSRTLEITDVSVVANTWYRLKIEYDGTDVKFYIDGVLKKTITTNIPTVAPRLGVYNRNYSGASGRDTDVDLIDATFDFTGRF